MYIRSVPFSFQRIYLATFTLGCLLGAVVGCNNFQPETNADPDSPPPSPVMRDLSDKATLFGIDETTQEALVVVPGKNLTLFDKNWNSIQRVEASGWQTGLVTEDNRHAILQNNVGTTEVGTIQMFDASKRAMLKLPGAMDSIVEGVVTSTEILAVDQKGLLVRWDLTGTQVDQVQLPQSNSKIDAIDISLDGKWIFFVQNTTLFAYEIATKTVATSLDLTTVTFVSLKSVVSVRVRKQMAIVGSKGQILMIEWNSMKKTFGGNFTVGRLFDPNQDISHAQLAPDGARLTFWSNHPNQAQKIFFANLLPGGYVANQTVQGSQLLGASMIGDKVFGLTSTNDQVQVTPHEVTFADPVQEFSMSEPIQDTQICAEDYLLVNGAHTVSMWDITGASPTLFWQYINPSPIQQIRCTSFRFSPRVLITDQSDTTAYFMLQTGALPTKPDSVLIPGGKIYDADFYGLGTNPELLLTAGSDKIYLWSATQTGTQLTPLATLQTRRTFPAAGQMRRAFFTHTGNVVAVQENDINGWWVSPTSPTTKFTPDQYSLSDPRNPNTNPVVWAKPMTEGKQFATFHPNGDVQYWSLDTFAPIEIFIGAAKSGTLSAFDSVDRWLSDWIMDVDQNTHTVSLWTTIDLTGTFSVPTWVTSTAGLDIKQALYASFNTNRLPATLSKVAPGERQCLPGIETWSSSYFDDQDPSIRTARIEICSAKVGFEPKVLNVDTHSPYWTFLQTENNKIQVLSNQPILRPSTAKVLF